MNICLKVREISDVCQTRIGNGEKINKFLIGRSKTEGLQYL